MFANFKAKLLKVDLRKGGKKVFVLETSSRLSAGELEAINEMIDQEVAIGLDSQVISYRIKKNARTDEPLINYKVREGGIVEEVMQQGEQAEMELGLPAEKQKIKEVPAEIKREVVVEFISDGLAPRYEDLDYDFAKIIQRHADGESYLRIASELELSSGKLAELLDDYCKRVAPLAAKWDEWREGQAKAVDDVIAKATTNQDEAGQEPSNADQKQGASVQEPEPTIEEIEQYVITKKPKFEDIKFDPEILQYKVENKLTWQSVAAERKIHSGDLGKEWSKYKKRVAELMKKGAA